jgi:GT2 family glycosyltransferase
MSAPELSVVILSWNEREQLDRCLRALEDHPPEGPMEIIVVDQGSTDGTLEMLSEHYSQTRVIANETNKGISVGRNQGMRISRGRFIVMLDSDAYVTEGALQTLADYLDEHPQVGLVGPRLENVDGSLQLSCRRFPTPMALVANRVARLEDHPSRVRHLMIGEPHDAAMPVQYVLGATMFFRRSAAAQVGGFVESFPFGCDDADWGLGMWSRGWLVHYVPSAVVVHDYRRRAAQRLLNPHNLSIAFSFLLVALRRCRVLRDAPWKRTEGGRAS